MPEASSYEENYQKLPFEDVLRHYRIKNIIDSIKNAGARKILEIGCGYEPFFSYFNDYESMVTVEPGKQFFQIANLKSAGDPRITLYNGILEEYVTVLSEQEFDFIIIGGFIHEISNPEEVLSAIHRICRKHTVVYCFAPNARSFHRLLAFEAGLIDSIYELSGHDKLFMRHQVFDIESIEQLFSGCGFRVQKKGSYYIKPFTNSQMAEICSRKIIDESVIEGLDRMIRYLPDMGSELYVEVTVS